MKPKNFAKTVRFVKVSALTTYSRDAALSFGSSAADRFSISNDESFVSSSSLVTVILSCSMNGAWLSAATMKSRKKTWWPGNWKLVLHCPGATSRWLSLFNFDGSMLGRSIDASCESNCVKSERGRPNLITAPTRHYGTPLWQVKCIASAAGGTYVKMAQENQLGCEELRHVRHVYRMIH